GFIVSIGILLSIVLLSTLPVLSQGPGTPAPQRGNTKHSTATASPVGGSTGGENGLIAKAQAQGLIQVIETVNAPFQPEGRLNAQAAAAQRAGIQRVQTAILNRLASRSAKLKRAFRIVPQMALEVDAATLQALAALPEVTNVQEDVPVPPVLA